VSRHANAYGRADRARANASERVTPAALVAEGHRKADRCEKRGAQRAIVPPELVAQDRGEKDGVTAEGRDAGEAQRGGKRAAHEKRKSRAIAAPRVAEALMRYGPEGRKGSELVTQGDERVGFAPTYSYRHRRPAAEPRCRPHGGSSARQHPAPSFALHLGDSSSPRRHARAGPEELR
jgi:hypothetical protein